LVIDGDRAPPDITTLIWQNLRDEDPEKFPYETDPLVTVVPSPEL
jgi:hypothetical protein